MDKETASKIVLVSGGIMAVWVLVSAPKGSTKTYKRLWGIGALTLGLSIMADFLPEIAGPFALLVLAAGTVKNQGKIGRTIQQGTH